jgi:serine/threonine-protein kinase RsbW
MRQHSPAEDIQARVNETVELSIDSKIELVELVERVSRSVAAKMGFNEDDTSWIELAVREAVANAIIHGNRYLADKRVYVQFFIEPAAITIYVSDCGEGFDPTRLLDPLALENLHNLSGRGVLLMRTFMDEVEYNSHPDGCVVRMTKYRR